MVPIISLPEYEQNLCFVLNDTQNAYPHIHPELELIYVLSGEITVRTQADCRLCAEDFMVFPPYQLHSLTGENAQVLSLYVSEQFLHTIFPDRSPAGLHCLSNDAHRAPEHALIRQLLAELFGCYTSEKKDQRYLFWDSCLQLLELLFRLYGREAAPSAQPDTAYQRIIRITRYTAAHYTEPLSLQVIAQREYITPSYFSKMFRKCVGCTFMQYLGALRLSHAMHDLTHTAKSITDIALDNGFSNTNRFIRIFHQQYGETPGRWRIRQTGSRAAPTDTAWDRTMLTALLRHRKNRPIPLQQVLSRQHEVRECTADFAQSISALPHNWDRILNIGAAFDCLIATVQDQIRQVQQQFHFSHIRLSGIMDDNVLIFHQDEHGQLICNFVYWDIILDFCLSEGLSPFLEFSFMPSQFAKNSDISMLHNSCISGARDYTVWEQLIRHIMRHLVQRYGTEQLKTWMFSPMRSTYVGSLTQPEDYLTMYHILHRIIKQEYGLWLCGLGSDLDLFTQHDCAFLKQFAAFCERSSCFPDCLTMQSYNCIYSNLLNGPVAIRRFYNQTAEPFPLSNDPAYMKNGMAHFTRECRKLGLAHLPVLLEDWGFTQWQRDPRNDTAYKATFLVKNVLENRTAFSLMATLKLTDLMEETSTKIRLFHGGHGLFTVNGIPKPPYYAMKFLDRLGSQILLQEDGLIITRQNSSIQILLYYYCHSNHTSNQNYLLSENPYASFIEGPLRQYNIRICGIPPRSYQEEFFSVSPKKGSSYDTWINMGAPDTLTAWQTDYLRSCSQPEYKVCIEPVHDVFQFTTTLSPHEVQLIALDPI